MGAGGCGVSRALLRRAILAASSLEGKEQEMIRKHFRIRRYVIGLAFAAALIAPAAAQAVTGITSEGPATGVQQTDARHAALLNKQTVAPASPIYPQATGIGQQAYEARLQAMAQASKRLQAQPTGIGQQAYAARMQAMADRYQSMAGGKTTVRSENSFGAPGPSAGGAQGPVAVKTASVSSSSGFDWNDAGIGAAVAFGIALLLVAAVAIGRRYRSHHGTGLASA